MLLEKEGLLISCRDQIFGEAVFVCPNQFVCFAELVSEIHVDVCFKFYVFVSNTRTARTRAEV